MTLRIQNARIWTGDPACPWLDSLHLPFGQARPDAISESPVVGLEHRVIDARGCTIVPGLIDSHVHLLMGGKSLGEVDLSRIRSRIDFERAIAEADANLPPGRWLIGRGWSEQNWPGGDLPDMTWLDRAGDRPCVCHRMDIHAVVVNRAVVRMLDRGNLREPAGGTIVRDAHGRPNGLFFEAAAWELVNPLIPNLNLDARRECLLAALKHANAMGLTAVGSMELADDVRDVFVPMRDQLTLRCAITLLDRETGDGPITFEDAAALASRFDEFLSVIGCKTFIDGTLGSHTARMLADYSDAPGQRGMLVELAARGRLNEWIRAVADAGLSPSMHAIGDEANSFALDAIEALPAELRQTSRPRIEHAQHVDPTDVRRWVGRIASMQPLHKADDGRYIEARLGKERARGAFAFRDLRDAGAVLAFGSDWPVVSCDPILGMRAAITGLTLDDKPFNIEQNLTVEQALRAYTRDAAYCLQMDGERGAGVLQAGRLGDCVMFDIDPFIADWVRRPPRVILTVVGGKVVFDET